MQTDLDRQRFARKCWARRRSGLVLSGSWTRLIKDQLHASGAIYDGVAREWLLPDVATMNRFLAMRPGTEKADPMPDIRRIVATWQAERGLAGEPWGSDLQCAEMLLGEYGVDRASAIAVELARYANGQWGDCQSLHAAWKAFGTIAVNFVEITKRRLEKARQAAVDAEAQRLDDAAEQLRMKAIKVRYEGLPQAQRQEIEKQVKASNRTLKDGIVFSHLCYRAAGLLTREQL